MRSAALACLAAGMLACGASVPAAVVPAATPPAITAAQYLGPATATVNYGDHDVHLAPPTGSPAVDWTSALNVSCLPFCVIAKTKGPVVELVSFSDDQYMVDGSNSPIYQHVLAYAVIWRAVPCTIIGGPIGHQPTPNPNQTCDDFFLVDATSGQALALSYQYSALA
jgi:hypothetical protein